GKEVVREALGEGFGAPAPTTQISQTSAPVLQPPKAKTSSNLSYLDYLDSDQVSQVNDLVDMVGTKGIRAAIAQAKNADAFVLDAFHDALVDKLHTELKERGII
ncbi:MAG: hypothetical protein OXT67_00540, partial [Zetaproteobacteria bacterium]|nr:hypothetical protein [Zetaproteobacteria bacterium]